MKRTNAIKRLSLVIAVTATAFLVSSCGKVKEEQFGIGSPTTSTYTDSDLVWVENFNQKELDTDNWLYEVHYPGWVNRELQSYVVSDENIYLKDGKLIIQPLKKGRASYTSGRINTLGKKEFTYGRFEARLKVPRGKGFLPAFWMMPANESLYGSWPKCGEIDIMEVLGDNVDTVYGSLHFGDPHTQRQGSAVISEGNFADDFHIFAVEWEPDEMRFYVDDNCYYKTSDWFTKKSGSAEVPYPAPFNKPFYIILNVAVGGNWPGKPDEYTTFDEQAQMVVDYVKVYQKKSYNEDVKKPEVPVVKMQVKEGNLVSNLGDRWSLHLEPDGKATADLSDNGLTVVTTEQGAADYSVQLVQSDIQMVKGKSYKYTFDAWADEPRTIKTAITFPNNGWQRAFGDVSVDLDTKKKTYAYTFTNGEISDENARLEFQLGATDSKAAVHIQNIKIEHVKE